MDIPNFLKKRRKELGLTQQDLTDRLASYGYEGTHSRVGHWEKGRNLPPIGDPKFREVLALALEISVNNMLIQMGYEVTDDDRSGPALTAANLVERMTPEMQRLAIEQLKALANYGSQSRVG